ncbi:MAG: dephospho-CoA kinase [Bacteroidales bacterium]|jgi:dephospho-CoA kinase|nr:dephospho-CoA kinase [Bacteroidales bacterium]
MLTVGVTGGIGSGKTTVCEIFELLGVPVYYADIRAKELMNFDPELREGLKTLFGQEIYENELLNRKKLAEIIFNDKSMLEKVNGLVHPAVGRDFIRWRAAQTSPYIIEEAAILFESNAASRFDKIVLVTAPEQLRIERVRQRDVVDAEAVRARMKNQWPEEKKIKLADFVINNDDKSMLLPQVMHIHQQLTDLAKVS